MAIHGPGARGWDIGDCQTMPNVSVAADSATFDFVKAGVKTRFTFRDGDLSREDFAERPQYFWEKQAEPANPAHEAPAAAVTPAPAPGPVPSTATVQQHVLQMKPRFPKRVAKPPVITLGD
jgi:hypothetical protein